MNWIRINVKFKSALINLDRVEIIELKGTNVTYHMGSLFFEQTHYTKEEAEDRFNFLSCKLQKLSQ